VEGKRIRSASQIEKRGRQAAAQLRTRLDRPDHRNMVGVVAFDFTPMLNPLLEPLVGARIDAAILLGHVMQLLQPVINQNARHWRAWEHPRIVAVFNRVLTIGATIGSDALLYHLLVQSTHPLAKRRSLSYGFIRDFKRAAPRGAFMNGSVERKFTL
jgi:hypothetical protein